MNLQDGFLISNEIMNKRENRLYKNTVILVVCTLINKGLLFIMLPFFTRWLTVDDYGKYDVLITYVTLLIPIISLATSNGIFRLAVEKDSHKNNYIASGFALICINLLITLIIILWIGNICGWSNIYVFCLLLMAQVLDDYFQGTLRAIKKIHYLALCKTMSVLFTVLFSTIFIKVADLGLKGLLMGYALGYCISNIIVIIRIRFWKYLKYEYISFKYIRELVSYSWPLIPNDMSWWVIGVSDRSIISYFLGVGANAIYAIACKIPNLCTSIFGVFNISWQESASDNIDYNEKQRFFQNVYDRLSMTILCLCTLILSFNYIFFDYIFDSRYTNARLYTSILVTAVIFNIISLYYGGIQISLKRTKINGISTIIGAIINISFHLLFVKLMGIYAAALSTLLSNMVVFFIRKKMLKEYSIKSSKTLRYIWIIYLYYVYISTLVNSLVFNLINMFIACLIVGIINRKLIIKLFRKIESICGS